MLRRAKSNVEGHRPNPEQVWQVAQWNHSSSSAASPASLRDSASNVEMLYAGKKSLRNKVLHNRKTVSGTQKLYRSRSDVQSRPRGASAAVARVAEASLSSLKSTLMRESKDESNTAGKSHFTLKRDADVFCDDPEMGAGAMSPTVVGGENLKFLDTDFSRKEGDNDKGEQIMQKKDDGCETNTPETQHIARERSASEFEKLIAAQASQAAEEIEAEVGELDIMERKTFTVDLNDVENISVRLTGEILSEQRFSGLGTRRHPLYAVTLVIAGIRRERRFRFDSFRGLQKQIRTIAQDEASLMHRSGDNIEILSPFPPSYAKSKLGVKMSKKELRTRAILLNCWIKEVFSTRPRWTRRHRAAVALFLSEGLDAVIDDHVAGGERPSGQDGEREEEDNQDNESEYSAFSDLSDGSNDSIEEKGYNNRETSSQDEQEDESLSTSVSSTLAACRDSVMTSVVVNDRGDNNDKDTSSVNILEQRRHNLHAAQVVTPITSGEGEESGSGEAKETRAYSSRNPLPLGETSVSRSRRSVHKQKRRNAALMRGSSAPVDGDVLCNHSRAERSRSRSTAIPNLRDNLALANAAASAGRSRASLYRPSETNSNFKSGAQSSTMKSSKGGIQASKISQLVCNEELWASFQAKMLSDLKSSEPTLGIEDVGRFTNSEFAAAIASLTQQTARAFVLAYHFTSLKSAKAILAPGSGGIRASKEGQLGGGVSFCVTPPYELGWEQYGGGRFRAAVGKALWGEKAAEVELGGSNADKLETVLIAEIHINHVKDEYRVPQRPDVLIMPFHSLNPASSGEAYFPKQRIVKAYMLTRFAGEVIPSGNDTEINCEKAHDPVARGAAESAHSTTQRPGNLVRFDSGLNTTQFLD